LFGRLESKRGEPGVKSFTKAKSEATIIKTWNMEVTAQDARDEEKIMNLKIFIKIK
jgi:hypothetical protein